MESRWLPELERRGYEDRDIRVRLLRHRFALAACQALAVAGAIILTGCGTTRLTDTQRTATEQLLVSNAIDQAISEFSFGDLAGKSVYLDTQYLEGAVDKGYLISTIRHHLLTSGCVLLEEKNKATYIVEVRSGAIGTDRHALLVGIPQMNVPTFVPGQPSFIPEIPLAKKTDQEGVAKVAIFAYNRITGQLVWQSGMVKALSTSKDTWVLGAGPFQQGTIRSGTEFAGELLMIPHFAEKESPHPEVPATVPFDQEASWIEMPPPKTDSNRLAWVLANPPTEDHMTATGSEQTVLKLLEPVNGPGMPAIPASWPWNNLQFEEPSTPSTKPKAALPSTSNKGGQAETEPSNILSSGLGSGAGAPKPDAEAATILDTATGFKPDGN
jgi:hypothetical protein